VARELIRALLDLGVRHRSVAADDCGRLRVEIHLALEQVMQTGHSTSGGATDGRGHD
jgi:hypothetical protein